MPRLKRTIRVRREGEVISETRPTKRKARKVRRPPVRTWGMTKTEERLHCPMPSRKDLTAYQWREYGDALRVLNRYEYINADLLSLSEARAAIRSIQVCSGLRFIAQ